MYLQVRGHHMLFPFLVFFLSLSNLYAQRGESGNNWKSLLVIDSVQAYQKDRYFLVVPRDPQMLFSGPGVELMRQLDHEYFVIAADSGWLKKNIHDLVFMAPANNNWKLSPALLKKKSGIKAGDRNIYHISVKSVTAFQAQIKAYEDIVHVLDVMPGMHFLRIETSFSALEKLILPSSEVIFAEQANRFPKEEAAVSEADNTLNTINKAKADHPEINGAGLVVSVKENLFDTTDIDFSGRIMQTDISSHIISSHATNTATVIAGAGNTYYTGRGAAWGATLSGSDFKRLWPDLDAYAKYGISVQNHSYGVGIENYYGSDAAAYDESALIYPSLLHVFSSGNSGDQAAADGRYAGITGFANITGSFKMSKNTLSVGSVNAFNEVAALSSKGPAHDGRVKPELVAYGESGSSEAAAIVSGIALLVQHAYASQHSGTVPDNALVKGLLINSATDVSTPGIDFSSGYGSANAYRAVLNTLNGNYVSGSVAPGEEKTYSLHLPANAVNLKVTLTWSDAPAVANAYQSLVNDLDLKITRQADALSWLPWVLNSYPHKDSLQLPARRHRDSINVVEQVTIEEPGAGDYIIQVKPQQLSTISQSFFVCYQWDELNHFIWTFPAGGDQLLSHAENILRWENHYKDKKGKLEYSDDEGKSWQLADDDVQLADGYYIWNAPDTFASIRARMVIDNDVYETGAFTITPAMEMQVGLDCKDSTLMFWNTVSGATQYAVYNLNEKYLQHIATTADTFVVIRKTRFPRPYFAVAPRSAGAEGLKSHSINTSLQGVGCYIRNFLADLQPDLTVTLKLTLGTDYLVKRISFEKQVGSGWTLVQVIDPVNAIQYTATDNNAADGVLRYRAKIELENGQLLYTDMVMVYKLAQQPFLVFPNPVPAGQSLKLLSRVAPGNYHASLYDIAGRKIMDRPVTDIFETLPFKNISKGIYLLIIYDNNKAVCHQKIVVW